MPLLGAFLQDARGVSVVDLRSQRVVRVRRLDKGCRAFRCNHDRAAQRRCPSLERSHDGAAGDCCISPGIGRIRKSTGRQCTTTFSLRWLLRLRLGRVLMPCSRRSSGPKRSPVGRSTRRRRSPRSPERARSDSARCFCSGCRRTPRELPEYASAGCSHPTLSADQLGPTSRHLWLVGRNQSTLMSGLLARKTTFHQ